MDPIVGQVKDTVYSLFGVSSLLDSLDEEVVRPIGHHRYQHGPKGTPPPPKIIFMSGKQGCGHRSVCSALVNELRRGRSNKRGDVHYNNRDVKYFEWNFRNTDSQRLEQVFTEAKNHEFTVLTMHGFGWLCPSTTNGPRNDERSPTNFKTTLLEQLDRIKPGKILVVASSSKESDCDEDVMKRMEYKYELALPDEEVRKEIILKMLEDENAELTPPSLLDKLVHATRHGYTTEQMISVVNGALRQARARQHEQQQNGGRADVLRVKSVDWTRYLDIVLEQRTVQDRINEEEESDEEENQDLQPPAVLRVIGPAPRMAQQPADLMELREELDLSDGENEEEEDFEEEGNDDIGEDGEILDDEEDEDIEDEDEEDIEDEDEDIEDEQDIFD